MIDEAITQVYTGIMEQVKYGVPTMNKTATFETTRVTRELGNRKWRRNSAFNGDCVEITVENRGLVGVGDSKDPHGHKSTFHVLEWADMLARIKTGLLNIGILTAEPYMVHSFQSPFSGIPDGIPNGIAVMAIDGNANLTPDHKRGASDYIVVLGQNVTNNGREQIIPEQFYTSEEWGDFGIGAESGEFDGTTGCAQTYFERRVRELGFRGVAAEVALAPIGS
jgi:hypothetical protein